MEDILYYATINTKEWIVRHRKIVLFLFLLIIIIIGSYMTWTYFSRLGKIAVEVDVFPDTAKVQVDGVGDLNRGTHYLNPGKYHTTVSGEGYKTIEMTVEVTNENPSNIYSVLPKDVVEIPTYTTEEKQKMQRVEGKSGAASLEFTQNFEQKYPIVKLLPIKDAYYQIGYLSDGKGGNFYLTVYTESPRYRSNALKRIDSLGVDLSDYKVVFQDFTNPLTGEKQ
jgi:hypothetical protein